MGIVASNASPILYRGGPRPSGGGDTTAYMMPSGIPGFRRRVVVRDPRRPPVSFPVILNRAVVAARQSAMGRRGLHGLGADNTLATGQSLINFCASVGADASAYPACGGVNVSQATGVTPGVGTNSLAAAQSAAQMFTAGAAPPILQSTCVPSTNPSDWGTAAYAACNNSLSAVSQVNDENSRRYAAYQNAYANWIYDGQTGPPPPVPVYMTLNDWYSANPSLPGPPPGSIVTAPAGSSLATSGGEYTNQIVPPGAGAGAPGAPPTGGGGSTNTGSGAPPAAGGAGSGSSGAPQSVPITFQFTNSSRPGLPLQVGDSWSITVLGSANSVVTADATQNGAPAGTGTNMGTTNSTGKLVLSGTMDGSTVGHWVETWHIGGQSAQLVFDVAPAPAGTSPNPTPTPTGGGGSTPTGTGLPPGAGAGGTAPACFSLIAGESCIGPIGMWTGLAALVLVWLFFFAGKHR